MKFRFCNIFRRFHTKVVIKSQRFVFLKYKQLPIRNRGQNDDINE